MKATSAATAGLWAIVILLLLNLLVPLFEPGTASAQKDANTVGRYQIASWALSTGGTTHYTGYYVLDTATGKMIDKRTELHKQGEFDTTQKNEPEKSW